MVDVTFWGVRGSTPCPCEANARYGGNTACVSIEAEDHDPVILDLGTGLRFFGENYSERNAEPLHALALVTHLHWDHVQGLPFFTPLHRLESRLEVRGRSEDGTLEDAFEGFMRPPYFPVRADELGGTIEFVDVADCDFTWGRARVAVRDVPHGGATNGYRVEIDGVSIAYISDHQEPIDGGPVPEPVIELCRDADVVIHDAQYEPHEFAVKATWGHCTVGFAVRVAAEAGARQLVLFHHDPSHGDEVVDRLLREATEAAAGTSLERVVAAYEGLTLRMEPGALPAASPTALAG
ncbi:MAG: MBL fold metallo-hydrolase [Acidimicrobiales bacterium]|nr:MBL fold metallo-hydrolase [Acidimicrobiales bacterium]